LPHQYGERFPAAERTGFDSRPAQRILAQERDLGLLANGRQPAAGIIIIGVVVMGYRVVAESADPS
jgi:hypothetical protein